MINDEFEKIRISISEEYRMYRHVRSIVYYFKDGKLTEYYGFTQGIYRENEILNSFLFAMECWKLNAAILCCTLENYKIMEKRIFQFILIEKQTDFECWTAKIPILSYWNQPSSLSWKKDNVNNYFPTRYKTFDEYLVMDNICIN